MQETIATILTIALLGIGNTQEFLPTKSYNIERIDTSFFNRYGTVQNDGNFTGRYFVKDSLPVITYVQSKTSDSTLWMFDNQKVLPSFIQMINPDKIEKIDVSKGNISYQNRSYNARIDITSKDDYHVNIYTLNELIGKYFSELNEKLLVFLINGEPVMEDYDQFTIDEKFILKIDVYEKTFNSGEQVIPIVNLITRTKENLKKDNTMYLRG